MLEIIKLIIYMLLGAQAAYFIVLFLIGSWAMEWYEWGTFENPDNLFKKIVNFFTISIFGLAYWVGRKVQNKNFLMRKVIILICGFLYFIVMIILIAVIDPL
ncbi:hypothetical protein M3936_04985 [Sutcliffiella horikoshii]|uniref:hypothetical protein n=1 Tax=Sutcliffiella horikoshii TaxID=79883 RepID=UPI0007D06E7D|nr:hypothetical protein [Sutcliffiella horikoshii]MCM3616936.1 hypothetical protein [Sutcliffiella horikoshii]